MTPSIFSQFCVTRRTTQQRVVHGCEALRQALWQPAAPSLSPRKQMGVVDTAV